MTLQNGFDSRSQIQSSDTYFLHQVDQASGTLRVQILGAGLSNTFLHQQAGKGNCKQITLAQKTSGFLAAITASHKRIVLAWAESGHGIGRHGDRLKASGHVLGNARWACRAIKLAKILELDLTSPFDWPTAPQGSFQAAHVEVKLATHAAMLLLQQSRTQTANGNNGTLTRKNLAKLQHLRWRDGSPIRFQIFVSRKNCHRCGAFLSRLQELTGVQFDLKQGTRVVPIQYHQQQLRAATQLGLTSRSSRAQGSMRQTTTTTTSTTTATRKLNTYEENGVIFYMPPEVSEEGLCASQVTAPVRIPLPIRVSPHHLSDVHKPLPATPVTEDPAFTSSDSLEVKARDVLGQLNEDDSQPFPPRSPRPYSMSL